MASWLSMRNRDEATLGMVAMRLSVDLDKLEEVLNRRRTDGKGSRLMFPPRRMSHYETVPLASALRHALLFLLLILAQFASFFVLLPLVVVICLFFSYRHLFHHHVPWHLMTLLYGQSVQHMLNEGKPSDYFFPVFGVACVMLAVSLASRWAWNRRADRLNREAILPPLEPVVVPGVWPPPPTGRRT